MILSTPSSGHASGLPAVTYRTLLRASPAFMGPSLLAGPALAQEEMRQRMFKALQSETLK